MTSNHGRRLRKLEAQRGRPKSGAGRFHMVFVRPGEDRQDQVAKLVDYEPGDEIFWIHFVSPGDVTGNGYGCD